MCVTDSIQAWRSFHEQYAACIPTKGFSRWRYRGQSLCFSPQAHGLVEPGETHTTTSVKEPGDFQVLFVSLEAFHRAAEEQGLRGQVHFRLAQVEDPGLSCAVRGLAASLLADGTPLEQQSILALCIQRMQAYAEAMPRAQFRDHRSPAIKRVMECIQDRYQDPLQLEELSALAGLSRFALLHIFSGRVGVPPHVYQILVRIERARRLLEQGIPPGLAGAQVGFSDQSHFMRQFQKVMRISPGQYARTRLNLQ